MFAVWDFSKMFSNYDIGVILYGEWGEPSDETSPYGECLGLIWPPNTSPFPPTW
jgi:hypothetical protein